MKRRISICMAVLLTAGCASPAEQQTHLNSQKADMSEYYYFDDEDHAFEEVTLAESLRLFDEKLDGIILYSYTTCPFCNNAIPILNEIAKEYEQTVYYVDVYGQDLSGYTKEERTELMDHFMEIMDPTLVYNSSKGEWEFQVPIVMTVIDGNIVSFHIGITEDYKGPERITDIQADKLRETYRGLFDIYHQ